jgi:hypothetical protein
MAASQTLMHVRLKSPSGQLRPPDFNVVRIGRRTPGIQRPHEGFAAPMRGFSLAEKK